MSIDAHVHIRPVYDRGHFFGATVQNFTTAARRPGVQPGAGGFFLTETTRDDAFDELAMGQGMPPDWQVETLPADPGRSGCAGPVMRCSWSYSVGSVRVPRGLEVLAVGNRVAEADGQLATAILATLQTVGTPAILSWEAGEWMRARQLLAGSLDRDAGLGVLLGATGEIRAGVTLS